MQPPKVASAAVHPRQALSPHKSNPDLSQCAQMGTLRLHSRAPLTFGEVRSGKYQVSDQAHQDKREGTSS
jgi:hypothetical protein